MLATKTRDLHALIIFIHFTEGRSMRLSIVQLHTPTQSLKVLRTLLWKKSGIPLKGGEGGG